MLTKLLVGLFNVGAKLSGRRNFAALLGQLSAAYSKRLGAADALRFLFDLDNRLYILQGQMSVAYGNGVHTKHRHLRYHDFFIERVRAGERVLDIGCGSGAVAYEVAEKAAAEVVAIDLNPVAIATARELFAHSRVKYIIGNVPEAIPGESFDVVILSNVLEHLTERAALLRCIQETANPRCILIRVPLFEREWRVPLKRELGVEWRLDATHEVEYTTESFVAEVTEAGLGVRHMEIRWGEIWSELCLK